MEEPLNIEAILAASERQSSLLSGAARMTDAERIAYGVAEFYNAAVAQGFKPDEDPEGNEPLNAAAENVEARIEGFVWSWTLGDLRRATNGGKGVKNLTLRINSPGGLAFTAYGIYDYLRQMARNGTNVTTVVEGRAASAGALIFMAGDRREMAAEMSTIMFHRSMGLLLVLASGNADDLAAVDVSKAQANAVNPLRRIDKDIASMLVARSGMDEKAVAKILKQDSYFDAKEAMERGIATDLVSESKAKPKTGDKPADGDKPKEDEANRGDHERRERNAASDRVVLNYFVMGS